LRGGVEANGKAWRGSRGSAVSWIVHANTPVLKPTNSLRRHNGIWKGQTWLEVMRRTYNTIAGDKSWAVVESATTRLNPRD
jgi:hypothetical protein